MLLCTAAAAKSMRPLSIWRSFAKTCANPSAQRQKQKTCLYDFHVQNGAKMVDFAGFSMPAQYAQHSVSDSALHTRTNVSIFDVSHMLQTHIKGKDRVNFMESLTTADIEGMQENTDALSVFTNDSGGIIDDLIVSKTDADFLYLVTNAGRIDVDLPHLERNANEWRKCGKDVHIEVLHNRALLAIQGPDAIKLLAQHTDVALNQLFFMQTTVGRVCGAAECRITRCGYTGEDGFEISVPAEHAESVLGELLACKTANVKMAGLGARDVLRTEAGLCLYGNDISEQTTPVEAGIAFVVAKRRRQTREFPGADKIVEQLEKKCFVKKRVGLISTKGGRASRAHMPIVDPVNKAAVGFVTSGCPSPTLGANIAMGYVDKECAKVGTQLVVETGGGRQNAVEVCKMPFVPSKYFVAQK